MSILNVIDMERKYSKLIQKLILITGGLMLLYGCNKGDNPPAQVNISPCVVTSAPSYFGTAQTFEYDQAGNLTSRRYEFGFPGYGPFTQKVDPAKISYTYTSSTALLEETDVFLGGTGNLYDGLPEMMIRREHQKYTDGRPEAYIGPDTLLTFQYDDKKRLSVVTYHPQLLSYDVYITYSRQLYAIKLELTYDDNNNVIRLEQTSVFREGVYIVNKPSDSYFVYPEAVQTVINVTYDNKPSPFTAVLKYWKFVQGDWGYVTNSKWQAIIAALSKNNPLTITYVTFQGKPSEAKTNITYNYNEQGFPIDSYTYNCK